MIVKSININFAYITVECPNCGYELTGFVNDPRGRPDIECENCETVFSVSEDAEVKIS